MAEVLHNIDASCKLVEQGLDRKLLLVPTELQDCDSNMLLRASVASANASRNVQLAYFEGYCLRRSNAMCATSARTER